MLRVDRRVAQTLQPIIDVEKPQLASHGSSSESIEQMESEPTPTGQVFRTVQLARQIISPATIPTIVREAFRLAQQERPGPVHLELPEDMRARKRRKSPLLNRIRSTSRSRASQRSTVPPISSAGRSDRSSCLERRRAGRGFRINCRISFVASRRAIWKSGFRCLREGVRRQGQKVGTADGLMPALQAAFRDGGVHLIAAPQRKHQSAD
jgi:hypothetical protein